MIRTTAEYHNLAAMYGGLILEFSFNLLIFSRTMYSDSWEIRIPFNLQNLHEEGDLFIILLP